MIDTDYNPEGWERRLRQRLIDAPQRHSVQDIAQALAEIDAMRTLRARAERAEAECVRVSELHAEAQAEIDRLRERAERDELAKRDVKS